MSSSEYTMQPAAGKPSLAAHPNYCTQEDKSGGKPCRITKRMFLLITRPNALVATITVMLPSCQLVWNSSLSLSLMAP